MRTIGSLIILLLAYVMAWGPAPAIAKDEAAIEQLQISCQPMTNSELEQVSGKNTNVVLQDDEVVMQPQPQVVQRTQYTGSNLQFQSNEYNRVGSPVTIVHIVQRNEG